MNDKSLYQAFEDKEVVRCCQDQTTYGRGGLTIQTYGAKLPGRMVRLHSPGLLDSEYCCACGILEYVDLAEYLSRSLLSDSRSSSFGSV